MLAGAIVVPGLGQSLLPEFKERDFLMHWLTTPSASHPEMVRITTQASVELRDDRRASATSAPTSARRSTADEVVGMYFGENWISVDPAVDYEDTVARIQEVVDGYPGLQRDVQTYLKERIREVLTGSSEAITVRIFGPDLDDPSRQGARSSRRRWRASPGSIDLHVQLQAEIPQIDVEVDLAAAERHGLKPGDVRRAASALIASEEVNDTYREGKIFDVRVWGTPEVRNSLASIEGLLLDTPSGEQVRLDEVATCAIQPTPNAIKREGVSRRHRRRRQRRRVATSGRSSRDVETAIASIEWPLGYHPEVLGEYAERQAAQDRLLLFAIAAAIGIFLLLQAAFGEHAAGHRLVRGAALGPRRRRARRGLARWRCHLAWLARRLLHRARHRGAQRDHAHQSLPASGAVRG